MNVEANQAIMNLPEVDDVQIYPPCGDETNAMGAAYNIYADNADPRTIAPLEGSYLDREFDDEAILKTLEKAVALALGMGKTKLYLAEGIYE